MATMSLFVLLLLCSSVVAAADVADIDGTHIVEDGQLGASDEYDDNKRWTVATNCSFILADGHIVHLVKSAFPHKKFVATRGRRSAPRHRGHVIDEEETAATTTMEAMLSTGKPHARKPFITTARPTTRISDNGVLATTIQLGSTKWLCNCSILYSTAKGYKK